MTKLTEQELYKLEKSLLSSQLKLTKAKESYEKFVLESSMIYRVFRLFLLWILVSTVVGAVLMIVFSRSKLALFYELVISLVILVLSIALIAYCGEKWGIFGVISCIPFFAFICLKVRSWVKSYLAGFISTCENEFISAQLKFDDAISRLLLPQIHILMMATIRDVMAKTSATHLREDTVIRVLEKEVVSGSMTKVPLADKSGVLYKSSINADMELCVLEID
jgi:hypothetical protein